MDEIQFHPEAEDEYRSTLAWYQARSPKAAERFEAETDRVLRSVATSPAMFPIYDQEHRFAVLRRYPYSIVYRTMPGKVSIIAIAHSRRSAGYWQDRK